MNKSQREESSILKRLFKIGWIDNTTFTVFRRTYRKINRVNKEYANNTM